MTPTVALTFDDGPGPWTTDILTLLAEHESRATFFVIGNQIKGNEQILQAQVNGGHEIGLHGWDHTALIDLPMFELRGQIHLSRKAVEVACGVTPRWWRSPWGRTTPDAADVILSSGLRLIGLGLDVYDTERQADRIAELVVDGLEKERIICLHDGVAPNGRERVKSRKQTVLALPTILEHCRSVTLSEMLA